MKFLSINVWNVELSLRLRIKMITYVQIAIETDNEQKPTIFHLLLDKFYEISIEPPSNK